MVPSKS